MAKRKLYGAAKKAHQRKLKRERDKRYREKNREKIRLAGQRYRARKKLRAISEAGILVGKEWKTPEPNILELIFIGYH